MITNCVCHIYRMTGDEDNREYELYAEDIPALVVPASDEIIALFGDVPVGALYSFLFSSVIDSVKPEDKIVIQSGGTSALIDYDELVVSGEPRATVLLGKHLIEGVAVKK